MGVHFLLSKSLAPTYYRLVKVNLTITALAKNFNTSATKNKEKRKEENVKLGEPRRARVLS